MSGFPWDVLGIAPTNDAAGIRKAYAEKLKALDVDANISAFAQLQDARGEALFLAKQDAALDHDDFGLGSWDDDGDSDDEIDRLLQFIHANPHLTDNWSTQDSEFHPSDSASNPVQSAEMPTSLSPEGEVAAKAWDKLVSLLLPNGHESDQAVSLEQYEQGVEYVQTLIDRAEQSDLQEHAALDEGLAGLFAQSWPRSGPFVEPANQAFNWLNEAGSLGERPALMFLNARIQGMQFYKEVQSPEHPLHAAWNELQRSGRVRFWDRMRIKRQDIETLIGTIRSQFPEIETHLKPERVASWTQEPPDLMPWIIQRLFLGFVIFQGLRYCADTIDREPDFGVAPISVGTLWSGVSDAGIDLLPLF